MAAHRSRHLKRSAGVTLVEMTMCAAIIGIIAVAAGHLMRITSMALVDTQTDAQAALIAQRLFTIYETEITTANQFTVATSTEVRFICDWNRTPGYNKFADFDGDGIFNYLDPDIDNDFDTIATAANGWKSGYNLKDDDDNNNNKIDMQVRVYFSNRNLVREINIDEAGWTNRMVIATDLKVSSFTFLGSRGVDGEKLDLGPDQNAMTIDTGQNDGVIERAEMDVGADGLPNTADSGEKDGQLNKAAELPYIKTIHLHIEVDFNKDGRVDWKLDSEISPPMVAIKNRSA